LPDSDHKLCTLALDHPRGPILCALRLPAQATIAAALRQARHQLQERGIDAGIDWDSAPTGIWGARCERDAVPRDGDRIEVYLPLAADPRERRRQRARKAGRT
jgi:uncharacterized protein